MSAELKFPDRTDELEEFMLSQPQVECETVHLFATNTYVRQITMPAGSIILGARHLTDHVNNVVTGRALVSQDGVAVEMIAPHVFVSKPGVRKVLLITEDMTWQTVHVVDLPVVPETQEEIDAAVARLEPGLVELTQGWHDHQKKLFGQDMKTLAEAEIYRRREASLCHSG